MTVQVAAIQLDVGVEESTEDRLARGADLVRAEAETGAGVVLLPEMWLRGWYDFDRYPALAEPVDGPTPTALAALAREAGVLLVAGSIVERAGDRLHNTTLVFGPDGNRLAAYRKIHLFSHEDAREAEVLSPGDGIAVVDVEMPTPKGPAAARVGLSICYDLRFPELYRRQLDSGAELLFIVSAWPYPRLATWRTLVRARALENLAAVVACNSAGRQAGHVYAGHSVAYDAWGEPLGELGDEPGVLRVAVDLESVRAARRAFPSLRDRVLGVPAAAT